MRNKLIALNVSFKYLFLVVTIVFSPMAFSTASQAQVIECRALDDFVNSPNSPILLTFVDPGPVNLLDDGSPGVIGDFRNITFGPLTGDAASTAIISAGTLSLSNALGNFAPLSIVYDANGAGLGLDLSTLETITFLLTVSDLPDSSVELTLTDGENDSASLLVGNLPNTLDGDELPTNVDFPIANFSGIGDVDLSNIERIEIEINATEIGGTDITLVGGLEICGPPPPSEVPSLSEWGMIAMAGVLGLVGFMVARRRKVTA